MNRKGRRIGKRSNRFVGFAPGYLSAGNEIRIDRPLLNPLPGSIDEVTEIGDLLGGMVFTGEDADEDRFYSMAPGSRILHLATHAFIDDEDPLKSVLVFTENPGADEDGLLNVYELYGLELDAGLAVLSACNTGSGKLLGGEGVMSLARAFFYAGVPSIIMTLWTVDDRKSYEVMLSFYKHLLRGRSAGTSLQRAKLEYMEDALPGNQHPRYWAGYFLVGDPKGLFVPYQLRAIPVIILLAFIAGLLFRNRNRKRKA
jgi:CHAT domain-containing protein